jgi:hypothetical protein
MSTVTDTLASSPELLAVAAVALRALLAWQRGLTWPEYRTLHTLKRLLFPRLARHAPDVLLWVSDKAGREDAEFIATYPAPLRPTVHDLRAGGATLHLLASVKRRPGEYGDRLSAAHLRWDHGTDQTEAYLFRNADGTTDVFAHFEASPETPLEHLDGAQTDGDPRGVVHRALGLSRAGERGPANDDGVSPVA